MEFSRHRTDRGGWSLALVAVAIVLCGAAFALGKVTEAVEAARVEDGGGRFVHPSARWIWIELDVDHVDPIAFYGVREFELDELPGDLAGDPSEEFWLDVVADEEYILWLNGRRVGSGRYLAGAPIDSYNVTPWLQAGTNRLVVELRSARGQGGFLASMVGRTAGNETSNEVLVVSDRRWRVVRAYQSGLIEGWRPLPGSLEPPVRRGGRNAGGGERAPGTNGSRAQFGEAPIVWGPPGTGRWRVAPSTEHLPLWSERFFLQPPIAAQRLRRAGPDRTTSLFEVIIPADRRVANRRTEAGDDSNVAGAVGYLTLRFANPRTARMRSALIHLGIQGPTLAEGGATDALAIVVPGEQLWRDCIPRRIDRIEVFGDAEALEAWVDPVDPAFPRGVSLQAETSRARLERQVEGIFGGFGGIGGFASEAPKVRPHIERRLRSRLYGMELPGTIVRSP